MTESVGEPQVAVGPVPVFLSVSPSSVSTNRYRGYGPEDPCRRDTKRTDDERAEGTEERGVPEWERVTDNDDLPVRPQVEDERTTGQRTPRHDPSEYVGPRQSPTSRDPWEARVTGVRGVPVRGGPNK